MLKKYLILPLLLLQLSLSGFSQVGKAVNTPAKPEEAKPAENTARVESAKPVAPKIAHPLPFKVGENLQYDIGFEKLIFSGKIGEMRLKTEKADPAKPNTLALKGEIISKGFFPALFGLNVAQNLNAIVSAEDLGVSESAKILEDGKNRKEHRMQIDREKGQMTYTFLDSANKTSGAKTQENTAPTWVQDILTAFYFARTQELKEGAAMPIPIVDEGKLYNIEIVAGKREEVKVDAGKFQTIKVEAKIFNGRFVRRNGEMFVWFSDDARRLPVKAKLKLPNATVNIELKKIQG